MLNKQKTFPFAMPVDWQRPKDILIPNPKLHDWLLNTGSLTERLQALTAHFNVDLLGQQLGEMDKSEARFLGIQTSKAQQKWQIREVILQGDVSVQNHAQQKDWVFARSVLPDELCNSKWANLGKQPLGKRIFNDSHFIRSDFEIGKLNRHPLTGQAFNANDNFWARRSKFTIADFQLIVAEAFLPDSPCYW